MSVAARGRSPREVSAGSTGRKAGPPVLPRRRSRTARDEPASEEDMRELQTAFSMFDHNQDGKICREDLRQSLVMLGHEQPTDGLIEKVIKNAGNRHGEIHEDSFILWMQRTSNGDEGVLRHAFNILDRDGDGYLCFDDLRDGLALLGETMSDKMLEVMFSEADRDRDGLVTYEDFVYVLKK